MVHTWKRKRSPDDVPTPVAVAVSDYCRRAKKPASAAEVREALSLLSEDDDFRVRELTDGEPDLSGLGPFAVIDRILGTETELCARRQDVGYYDVVRELVREQESKVPARSEPFAASPPRAVGSVGQVAMPDRPASRASAPAKLTVQEKIAPKKRSREDLAAKAELETPDAEMEEAASARKEKPAPRGRFRQLEPVRRYLEELEETDGRDYLLEVLEQARHRIEVRDVLARDFNAPHDRPINLSDVDAALQQHTLLEPLLKEERAQLSKLYREHRGASGRVAWALGISTSDLSRLVKAHEGTLNLEALRDTYRKEAMSPDNLTARLDLLGRTKYLADLGIAGKFEKALEKDLRALMDSVGRDDRSSAESLEAAALKADVPKELLGRALEKLGIQRRVG
jgi:hypothetical protein